MISLTHLGRASQLAMALDANDASKIVDELRASLASGTTRSYEWRVSQLKSIDTLIDLHEQEIIEALRTDLSKPEMESFVHEVIFFFSFFVFLLTLDR